MIRRLLLLLAMPGIVERMVAKTPAGRIGEPEDIADVVLFLCSDLSRFDAAYKALREMR
jgi:NAD(P)-dependent dehydrogenase (short-subunit alcohol dehydrogenase family)